MGAELIERVIRAKNINAAFDKAYRDAKEYSGHQEGYSGDMNTCNFTKDVTHMLKTMNQSKLEEHISDNCPKWEAWGFCIEPSIENKNKIKTEVIVTPQKGTRKWEVIYQAVDKWKGGIILSDKSQTECIKKARAYVEKHSDSIIDIMIAKVLVKGNTICAQINYKNSKTESDGLYKFIGLAGC